MKQENRHRLPLNLQLFAEPVEPTEPNTDPESDPQEPPKTFTQEELDRIVADRLARERKKAEKYADYDDIKAKLAELEAAEDERKRAEMTAAERLEAEKAEALKAAEEAQAERDRALTAANQRLIKAEFKTLARESNIPADRLDAALKLADLSGVTVDDDGNAQGVDDVVKALVEAHPYLAETKAQPKQIGGASGGNDPVDKTKEQRLKEAADKARSTGRLEDQVAYAKLKRELGM